MRPAFISGTGCGAYFAQRDIEKEDFFEGNGVGDISGSSFFGEAEPVL
jgi:hypothetical protein